MLLSNVKSQEIINYIDKHLTPNEVNTLIISGSLLLALKWLIDAKYSCDVKYDNGTFSVSCHPNQF